jgi:hypothetical protein
MNKNLYELYFSFVRYITFFFVQLGKLSVLRTFRVLRALKTVAVVPGMSDDKLVYFDIESDPRNVLI